MLSSSCELTEGGADERGVREKSSGDMGESWWSYIIDKIQEATTGFSSLNGSSEQCVQVLLVHYSGVEPPCFKWSGICDGT